MALRRQTIYLLRDVSEPDDALESRKQVSKVALSTDSRLDGMFYYSFRPPSPPPWIGFVAPLVGDNLEKIRSSSASGLLVLRVKEQFFAFTFGYGHTLLNMSKIETHFGLRVALNSIDPSHIRSLDTKVFEDMVVTKRTQASRSTDLPTFGVNISRDILRAVTGEPRLKDFGKRLSGSEALVLNIDLVASKIGETCEMLFKEYGKDDYKEHFGWIDLLALVRDKAVIHELDQQLLRELIDGDTSNTHMACPDALDWEDIDSFKLGGTGKNEYDDLDLDQYLAVLGPDIADITIEKLKRYFVSVRFSSSDDFNSKWRVYDSLVTEQRVNDQLHVLIEGRWFEVSESLVDEVDAFAASLPSSEIVLPEALIGESEPLYNKRIAALSSGELLLMDAKIRRPGGAASGIELCDLLSVNGDFCHVKRKNRSSTLSHLFAQGAVSANTFFGDGEFRDKIRAVINTGTTEPDRSRWLDLVPPSNESIERSRYSVNYVVIANSKKSGLDWLPFFSKLNLMQNGRQLSNLGFKTTVSRVSIGEPT
jgi:uncharacterized protein (TIGR04141 family)